MIAFETVESESGPTERWASSVSKLLDTLVVFLKYLFLIIENLGDDDKRMRKYSACKDLSLEQPEQCIIWPVNEYQLR